VVHCFNGNWIDDPRISIVWMLLIIGTGFLMVSNWRFWSGKEIEGGGRQPFQTVVLLGLAIAVIVMFSQVALITIALAYLVSGLLARIAYGMQRRRRLRAEAGR
jgi:CDP-diacylglycerol--serine O-phosphatidyltransferase